MKFLKGRWSKALSKVRGCWIMLHVRYIFDSAEMLQRMMPKAFVMKTGNRHFLKEANTHYIY